MRDLSSRMAAQLERGPIAPQVEGPLSKTLEALTSIIGKVEDVNHQLLRRIELLEGPEPKIAEPDTPHDVPPFPALLGQLEGAAVVAMERVAQNARLVDRLCRLCS